MGDFSASIIAISAGSRHISPLSFCEMLMIVAFSFAGMRRKLRVLSMRWATRLALCQQSWPSGHNFVSARRQVHMERREVLVQTVLSLCGQNQPLC